MSPPLPPPEPPGVLIARLDAADPNAAALALAALVGQGAAVAPALLAALPTASPPARAQIARALAEIAAPGTADALAALMADPDPLIRGRAAQGLARLDDPRATAALARTINDLPDELHGPYSVAVHLLAQRGEAVLPAIAPLLVASDPMTRTRAALVLRDVLLRSRGDPAWRALAARLGDPDPYGATPADPAVLQRWRDWVAAGAVA